MRRLVTYFPENNTAPLEKWEGEIKENEVEELKQIANNYPNKHIYTNKNGNLCINYGRYRTEIMAHWN